MTAPPNKHKIRSFYLSQLKAETQKLVERIADIVMHDPDLDLQIRDGYMNVYFKGGNLWRVNGITPRSQGVTFDFDVNYFNVVGNEIPSSDCLPKASDNIDILLAKLDLQKSVMRNWFTKNPKEERDLQHLISTLHRIDGNSRWIVIDIEYAAWLHGSKKNKISKDSKRLCKFDIIAVEREHIRPGKPLKLYLVEFKQGDGAIAGKSGLKSHIDDFNQFLNKDNDDHKSRKAFEDSMRNIIKEKTQLGLLPKIVSEADLNTFEITPCILLHNCSNKIGIKEFASKLEKPHVIMEYSECCPNWR